VGPVDLRRELERLAVGRCWDEVVARTGNLDDAALVADPKVAYLVAEARVHLGHMDRALNLALAAEAEFRTRHDVVNLLSALNLAGVVQFELGDLSEAEERFYELLELARERDNEEMSGRATNNLGAIASLRGDEEKALSLFRLSIPFYQKVGFQIGLAQTDHNLGIAHRDLGRWQDAERYYDSALRRARQLGDQRLAAMAQVGQAEVSHRRGDYEYAGAEARHALAVFAALGDELGRCDTLRLLGSVALSRSDWDEAKRCLAGALELARQFANPLLEAEVLEERAELHERTGRTALAHADAEVAAAIYRRLGATKRQQGALGKLRRLDA
jgi:tetratricopeptide (TPR) repeat protein